MKRLLILLMTTVMILSLSACFMLPDVQSAEWGTFTVTDGAVHTGDLVMVNGDTPYVAPADDSHLAAIADTWLSHTPAVYQFSNLSSHMDADALEALDKMLTDFHKATKADNVIIRYTYVSPEELGDLPADHLTGLGCELKYVVTEGSADSPEETTAESAEAAEAAEESAGETDEETDGEPETSAPESHSIHDLSEDPLYAWLTENCHRYGFVVRYPADKADKTGVSDYTDYFRYVGAPHAEYMKENSLCLEEYIELLKTHDRFNPMSVFANGEHFEIFYADVTESSMVLYPAYHSYTYSGVGKDGIVVIMKG